METNNEIKDFNIAEALKYAPKGLKLYSPIFGEVRFKEIDDDNCIVVDDKYNNHRWFYEYGTFFPSDENIGYVHELQHAMRLCGIEKEIVL